MAEVATAITSRNAASLAFPGPDNGISIATWQLSAIKDSFQNVARLRRKQVEPSLLLRPHQNARSESVRLNQTFHKVHLIDANREEESRQVGERFFAQCAPAIQIVAAFHVAVCEQAFVLGRVAGEAAGHRPDCASVERIEHHGMGHKPGDSAVAVHERMYPQQPVMGGGGRNDGLCFTDGSVNPRIAVEESR